MFNLPVSGKTQGLQHCSVQREKTHQVATQYTAQLSTSLCTQKGKDGEDKCQSPNIVHTWLLVPLTANVCVPYDWGVQ